MFQAQTATQKKQSKKQPIVAGGGMTEKEALLEKMEVFYSELDAIYKKIVQSYKGAGKAQEGLEQPDWDIFMADWLGVLNNGYPIPQNLSNVKKDQAVAETFYILEEEFIKLYGDDAHTNLRDEAVANIYLNNMPGVYASKLQLAQTLSPGEKIQQQQKIDRALLSRERVIGRVGLAAGLIGLALLIAGLVGFMMLLAVPAIFTVASLAVFTFVAAIGSILFASSGVAELHCMEEARKDAAHRSREIPASLCEAEVEISDTDSQNKIRFFQITSRYCFLSTLAQKNEAQQLKEEAYSAVHPPEGPSPASLSIR